MYAPEQAFNGGPEVLGLYWKRHQGNPRGLIGVDVGGRFQYSDLKEVEIFV